MALLAESPWAVRGDESADGYISACFPLTRGTYGIWLLHHKPMSLPAVQAKVRLESRLSLMLELHTFFWQAADGLRFRLSNQS